MNAPQPKSKSRVRQAFHALPFTVLVVTIFGMLRHRSIHFSFLAVILVCNLVPAGLLAQGDRMGKCSQDHFEDARIEAIDANYANLSIRDCIQKGPMSL
jgi:hypothetical protein